MAVFCRTGGPLVVSLTYEATRRSVAVEFELRIYAADGPDPHRDTADGRNAAIKLTVNSPGGTIEFSLAAVPLGAGESTISERWPATWLRTQTVAWWDGETRLHVQDGSRGGGQQRVPPTWRHIQADAGDRTLAANLPSNPPG